MIGTPRLHLLHHQLLRLLVRALQIDMVARDSEHLVPAVLEVGLAVGERVLDDARDGGEGVDYLVFQGGGERAVGVGSAWGCK
jgi:hypothetical protein